MTYLQYLSYAVCDAGLWDGDGVWRRGALHTPVHTDQTEADNTGQISYSSTRYVVRIGKNSCTGFPAKYNFLISVAVRVTNDIIFFILISYILRMANEQRISFFCRNSLFQCLNRYRYYNAVTARVTGFYDIILFFSSLPPPYISKVFLK